MLSNSLEHQKRFGQFFSGENVATMLVSMLPTEAKIASAIDPMAGVGDMLQAVKKRFNAEITGVEIDITVAEVCQQCIPDGVIYAEDAFSSNAIHSPNGWDLVITNPPYVRYQLQGNEDGVMPTAKTIRKNLLSQLNALSYLSDVELELFERVTKNYSGLSDMAVPSWILCAAMVRMGGYLAIVVPETWLSREYAAPIQYLLGKCFKIKAIAKETNERWFRNALVKTSLVIAQRCEMRRISSLQDETTTIFIDSERREVKTSLVLQNALISRPDSKWVKEEDREIIGVACAIPEEIVNALGEDAFTTNFSTLKDLGVECGQGLRTGANDFFYLNYIEKTVDGDILISRSWDGSQFYKIPRDKLIRTIQNRAQVDGLIADAEHLHTELLYLQSPVSEDDSDLAKYIKNAECYKNKSGKSFCELSAVRPNARIDSTGAERFWYMLPELAKRHTPNLCITRINTGIPECIFINQTANCPIVVDANMVTLWTDDEKAAYIAFAILNSTWCKCFLEHTCTVMGAGALKVEASHLKRLNFPKLSEEEMSELEKLAVQLCHEKFMTPEIQMSIDKIICSHFPANFQLKLKELLFRKHEERSRRA